MIALAFLTPTTPGTGPAALIVGIMSLAFALGAWARAGLYCNHQDLSPKYAAALLGELELADHQPTRVLLSREGSHAGWRVRWQAWRGLCRRHVVQWAAAIRRAHSTRPLALTLPLPNRDPTPPAGLSNTAGALPGVLGVTFAGYLLDKTGSWASALFFPTAACQLFGLVIYSIFASSKRQGWD